MMGPSLIVASRFVSRHVGRAASGDGPEPSHHAHFCALSRYGVIWEDRFYL